MCFSYWLYMTSDADDTIEKCAGFVKNRNGLRHKCEIELWPVMGSKAFVPLNMVVPLS